MASLQAYQSHGIRYYRIVESFRKNGKPALRVLAHLGRVDDILRLRQQDQQVPVKVSSVSAGAVTALYRLAREFDVAGRVNRAIALAEDVQVRGGLTVGDSLVAAMIARACAPRSKRAFADWANTTYLPELMDFAAADLTSQHFWDQMHAVPVEKLPVIEQELVRQVVGSEQLHLKALAYDTTNFFTHIASTNLRPKLPQRGRNKQGRHDLRQMGLALVVDQDTQLPLAHVLYEGARSDMKTFAKFLQPVRKRLRELTGLPEQLTIVFDAGASSRQNLEEHGALCDGAPAFESSRFAGGSGRRTGSGGAVQRRASAGMANQPGDSGEAEGGGGGFQPPASRRANAGLASGHGAQPARVGGDGLASAAERGSGEKEVEPDPRPSVSSLLALPQVDQDERGLARVRVWSDWEEYRRLAKCYFGLRVLVTDRAEWSTAKIIEAYRGQSKAEAAFRDLKDPRMLSTRPQFHWTDQKLHVHAWLCVMAYLLVTLLHRRATLKTGFQGSSRKLLAELSQVRCCRLLTPPDEREGHAYAGRSKTPTPVAKNWLRFSTPSPRSAEAVVYTEHAIYLLPSQTHPSYFGLIVGNSR